MQNNDRSLGKGAWRPPLESDVPVESIIDKSLDKYTRNGSSPKPSVTLQECMHEDLMAR